MVIASILAPLISVWKSVFGKPRPNVAFPVNGFTTQEFSQIRQHFKTLLDDDREGMALAVYVDNQLVVDLWGGYADKSANRLWTSDTMTCVFSITKLIASLVIAKLVSDGKLSYGDKVIKYWPEFGKWGKHMVTVEDLINHKAGLIGFCKPIELDQANDLDLISSIIEESVPYWEPCTGNGYHAVTYGFLLDQLVRRVDEKGRTVAQYHKEEVLSQDSTEFFIGLPGEKFHRVARITNPTKYENILALLSHPLTLMITVVKQLTGQLKLLNISAFSIPYLAVLGGDMKYNNPRVLGTANMACTGVATARGVAQAAMDFFNGEVLSPAVKTAIAAPTEDEADVLMRWKLDRGHGFIYSPHPTIQGKWLLLAMGYGGQFLEMDNEHNICIAMVRNGLRTEMGVQDFAAYVTVRDAILKIALDK